MIGVVEELTQEYLRKDVPDFAIGDTVDVHVKIIEGEKERIQVFNGTVIRRKGAGIGETFTVRRIVQGEGVERIFPLHSPNVADIEVKKRGRVRRAKLYYLRDRVGKGTRVREKLWTKPKDEVSAEEKERREATAAAASEAEAAERAKAKADAEQKAKAEKKKAEVDRKKKKAAKKDKRKAAKKKKGKASDKKDD